MDTLTGHLGSASLGLLLVRLVIGSLMAAHGAQKLFGWFGGYGLRNTGEFMVQLGFPSGQTFAAAAGLGELVSGSLVALGFLGPIGPALMISVMLVAMITVHWSKGLRATNGGVELPPAYATVAFGLALTGFGAYSLDALFEVEGRWNPTVTWIVLAIGILGGIGNTLIRRRSRDAGV